MAEAKQSLDSISLSDFPENEELQRNFDYDDIGENTVYMSRAAIENGTAVDEYGDVYYASSRKKTAAKSAPKANTRPASTSKNSAPKSTRPSKKKNKKSKVHGVIIALIIIALVAALSGFGFATGYTIFYDVPVDEEDLSKVEVTIDGTETDNEIGEMLLDLGLIDNIGTFKLRCKVYTTKYKAGTYKLSKSYNTEKLLNILAGYNYSEGTMDE